MPTVTKKYVSLEKLGLYDEKIKKVIADGDAAAAASALASAKSYADGLAVNYDAAGSAATAEANAKAYADGKDAAIQAAHKAGTDAATAAAAADAKAVAAQGEVDALEAYVGTFTASEGVDTVVKYIDAKTANIASDETVSALDARVTQAEKDIDAIEADYLKAADKTALEGQIGVVQTAVDTEKSRAEGIEAGLRTDINTVMGDYLKAADKTELQGNINTVTAAVERLTNGVSADEIDGVNDLIKYVKDHGAEVTGMQEDIADNADAIAGVAGRMDTAEGKITALETASALHAEKTYVDEQIEALQGADTGLGNRIAALEGKFGGADGSVEDMIADAKQEAIDAAASAADTKDEAVLAAAKKYADDEDALIEARVATLETASATHALASDLTALAGRVEAAEGEIDTLQSEMDAVEEKAANNEAAIGRLNTEVSGKVAHSEFDPIIEQINADIENNRKAISAFVEVSEEEINAMFA